MMTGLAKNQRGLGALFLGVFWLWIVFLILGYSNFVAEALNMRSSFLKATLIAVKAAARSINEQVAQSGGNAQINLGKARQAADTYFQLNLPPVFKQTGATAEIESIQIINQTTVELTTSASVPVVTPLGKLTVPFKTTQRAGLKVFQ
ncbi:hypothetical protein [Carboxydothermus ferrireducens]|uniref:Uncharacterized protein n=1 Tax=Carboxydothermus ferrireducens DSM 11255 TaxID=1119529 RepID=A0ABX2R7K8_9THEO|nr:hypothetical protein [Carboxydothermus ferrireducens]NYE57153.1 hypothetical protein [Carboxydothermus ferrireducens DSM 11255]